MSIFPDSDFPKIVYRPSGSKPKSPGTYDPVSIHCESAALAWPFLYSESASTAAAKATTETQ